LTLLVCLSLPLARAQETKKVVTPPANRAEDSKPNSNAVPDVSAISTQFQRVVLLRFKYNTDLLAGLESMVKEQKIKNAVILAGLGSVRNYQVHSVSSRNFPSADVFVEDPTAPADIIGMNGYVFDGRIHAHITLSTGDRAFGGHLEPHTNVFTFAIVTLGILNTNADLRRLEDETWR
ncbi:MAG TPA: PPC domain-containing DNA-binding protein, partial [Bryobacteraceae bacterium]|nr:PPC domain-containing DNA-binding protein [Bryobacteraceae bacterium]